MDKDYLDIPPPPVMPGSSNAPNSNPQPKPVPPDLIGAAEQMSGMPPSQNVSEPAPSAGGGSIKYLIVGIIAILAIAGIASYLYFPSSSGGKEIQIYNILNSSTKNFSINSTSCPPCMTEGQAASFFNSSPASSSGYYPTTVIKNPDSLGIYSLNPANAYSPPSENLIKSASMLWFVIYEAAPNVNSKNFAYYSIQENATQEMTETIIESSNAIGIYDFASNSSAQTYTTNGFTYSYQIATAANSTRKTIEMVGYKDGYFIFASYAGNQTDLVQPQQAAVTISSPIP